MTPRQLREWLSRPSHEVAPELLGWVISHTTTAGTVQVALTEVEAYAGQSDPASHAWRGQTARNAVMFGPAGHLYVYLSHGLHVCANIVTGADGQASAVLLRAGRVLAGVPLAHQRRARENLADAYLARGPGNLGRALGLRVSDSGRDLLSGSPTLLLPVGATAPTAVRRGPRIGISRAVDTAWRFWLADDPTVSAARGRRAQ